MSPAGPPGSGPGAHNDERVNDKWTFAPFTGGTLDLERRLVVADSLEQGTPYELIATGEVYAWAHGAFRLAPSCAAGHRMRVDSCFVFDHELGDSERDHDALSRFAAMGIELGARCVTWYCEPCDQASVEFSYPEKATAG
jgi:hypothetical protein